MKTVMVVTDITRMHRGMVCIAGYDTKFRCIRLVAPPPGIPESILAPYGQPLIFPFAVIEVDIFENENHRVHPPHVEDVDFDLNSIKLLRVAKNPRNILEKTLFRSVAEIFGQPIQKDPGFFVEECKGERSLGTITPSTIVDVIYSQENYNEPWDYRMVFYDQDDQYYRLKITDLTWRYYCDFFRGQDMEPTEIAQAQKKFLRKSKVYLRIGLSRGWKEYPDRCFLQVNGIYTFPDYLNGKTFLDYRTSTSIKEEQAEYEH